MIGFSYTITKLINLIWLALTVGIISYFLPIATEIFWLSTAYVCWCLTVAIARICYKIYQEATEKGIQ
jgi:hypothetical protein